MGIVANLLKKRPQNGKFIFLKSLVFFAALLFSGCAFLQSMPEQKTLKSRLQNFPTEGLPVVQSVLVYWNQYQVPFIEAQTDDDLALTLGVVHSHLRLGQMELIRRISQGRISEILGTYFFDVDYTLKIIDFSTQAEEIFRSMPEESKRWLSQFVKGINWYMDHVESLPYEYSLFGLDREPWSEIDVLTMSRMVAVDVNWIFYSQWLRLMQVEGWEAVWKVIKQESDGSLPSFRPDEWAQFFPLIQSFSRSGSNSVVVSSRKSASQSALIASDPHLGVLIPNFWMIIGYKSPSYHLVGLTIPGIPIIGIGRNPDIAWGGTNMMAISSGLVELDKKDLNSARMIEKKIKTKWWWDKSVNVRHSQWGPILTDSTLFEYEKPLALQWMGHSVSDEFTAFQKLSKAKNWKDFKNAFRSYSVSGQNFLYADRMGNIGQVLAYRLPSWDFKKDSFFLKKNEKLLQNSHQKKNSFQKFPSAYNPQKGYLVSANNRPTKTKKQLAFFYRDNNRMLRWNNLLNSKQQVSVDDLKSWQQDVMSVEGLELKNKIVKRVKGYNLKLDFEEIKFWQSFSNWDGNYSLDSKGAVAFEIFSYFLAEKVFLAWFKKEPFVEFCMKSVFWKKLLNRGIDVVEEKKFFEFVQYALKHGQRHFVLFKTWGDKHQLNLDYPLSNIPLLENKYSFGSVSASGSSDTIYKSAHDLSEKKTKTRYGANARHVSDLSDLDSNYFVLLGGQDGWLRSENNVDQCSLWEKGESIQVPLRLDSVKKQFNKVIVIPGRSIL